MKILITGGSGFVGKAVLRQIQSSLNATEVLVLARNSEGQEEKVNNAVKWHQCNLTDPQSYEEVVKNFSPEILIHLAWQGIPDFSFEQSMQNQKIAIDLLRVIVISGSCKKVIVSGTCFEYNKTFGVCKESDICFSKDYFTWAKHSLHDFYRVECSKNGIDLFWARFFYVYGPKQRSGSLIPTLINTLQKGLVPELRTPKNSNDFIHVDDVAEGIIKMIDSKIPHGIYNLGSGYSTPVTEVCRTVEKILTGKEELTNILEQRTAATEKNIDFWADMQHTIQNLGWSPRIYLQDGIYQTIHFSDKQI